MNLVTCFACGVVADFDACANIHGTKIDYYGPFTRCPNCNICLYKEEVSKYNEPFDTAIGGGEEED